MIKEIMDSWKQRKLEKKKTTESLKRILGVDPVGMRMQDIIALLVKHIEEQRK